MLDRAVWKLRGEELPLRDPLVMGILNVTPDSFSDGGRFADVDAAIAAGIAMAEAGAAIVDVGGESTRPYASAVDEATEAERAVPVVEGLASTGVVVSIDTRSPRVAEAAIGAGAVIVNDVSGLRDPGMVDVCANAGTGVVIMHMRGDPGTMQDDPRYDDVVREVRTYLADRCLQVIEAGVRIESIAIDPGIGFGKTLDHNLALLRNLEAFTHLGYPVALGTSRKGFLGALLEPVRGATEPADRDMATAATMALAVAAGVAILRVHNVAAGVDVAATAKAMVPGSHDEEAHRT